MDIKFKYNRTILFLTALIFFSSCSNAQIKSETKEIEEIDSAEINVFLDKFNSDSVFQYNHIVDSVEFVITDYFDEPGSGSTQKFAKDEILPLKLKSPVSSLTDEPVELNYFIESNILVIKITGTETGFLQKYYFVKSDKGDWELYKIVDDSV